MSLRRGYVRSHVFLILCACQPTATVDPVAAQDGPTNGPTHPPTTDEQWAALDTLARERAAGETEATLSEPVHLKTQGSMLQHRFPVRGSHCYVAALAWAFPSKSSASVFFQPRPDGTPVNDSVGGARGEFERDSGTLEWCADRDGEALLTVSALDGRGAAVNNELLEYALVVAQRAETPEQAEVRRQRDAAAGNAARQKMEANVAAAEERKAQNLADRCRRCREDFHLCRVGTPVDSCASKFYVCATGKYSGTEEEMRQCGAAPK